MAPLRALVPPGPPFRYAYDPPPGRPETNVALLPHTMTVHDIRTSKANIGLDSSGFDVLCDIPVHPQGNYDDGNWVTGTYYKEISVLLKERLNATRVHIFDHTIRRRDERNEVDGLSDRPGQRQPIYRVHIDQTPEAGRARVSRHLPQVEAERLLKTRVQIINVWRPIRGPVQDAPLGLCDAQSVDAADLVPQRLIYPDREASTYLVQHNPSHKWYYLADMQSDEAILIKCYDNQYPHSVAPHTGFTIEHVDKALPRHSIEVRCLVFYEHMPV